jgi:uncharacterized protein YkwD
VLLAVPMPSATAGLRDRRQMLTETNDDRVARDRRAVRLNAKLSDLARRHSRAMARQGRLFHTADPERYYLRGIRWSAWGENVGYTTEDARDLQRRFMDSRPHRENILTRRFDHVAIGAVRKGGRLWVTVFFYDR